MEIIAGFTEQGAEGFACVFAVIRLAQRPREYLDERLSIPLHSFCSDFVSFVRGAWYGKIILYPVSFSPYLDTESAGRTPTS